MNIPILSLNEMPESRLRELAEAQARAVLEARGVAPTPEAINEYFTALREDLEDRWAVAEEVPLYVISD